MKTGMQKCSFFDDATGTVVQLNSISEEGEIKIKEPLASKDADGGERFAGHHSRIEITGYDDTGYDQLKTWMDDKTPLKFVSYGIEGHILWYRETTITVKKNTYVPTGKNNSFTVVMEQKGGDHSGFDGNQIWYGKNLLYGAAGWDDTDGDGKIDNYDDPYGLTFTPTFVNGEQSILWTEAGTGRGFNVEFLYPISNTIVGVSQTINDTFGDKLQKIDIKDYNSDILVGYSFPRNTSNVVVLNTNVYRLKYLSAFDEFANLDEIKMKSPFVGIRPEIKIVNY